jgi:hypothetical protein
MTLYNFLCDEKVFKHIQKECIARFRVQVFLFRLSVSLAMRDSECVMLLLSQTSNA